MTENEFWESLTNYDKALKRKRVNRLLTDIQNQEREPVSKDDVINLRIDLSKINTIDELLEYFNK